ncbi:agamous-like MADS-box protein AGL61 [Apium graveolens]|uniref:agamous-like MADS-box protein AGL61 n=1 Tax=Apium graveolens TaxID=4045 RepID=UPI003D79B9BF
MAKKFSIGRQKIKIAKIERKNHLQVTFSKRRSGLLRRQIFNELEGERKRGEALDDMRQASQSQFWWESPVEKMGFDELQQLKDCMEAAFNQFEAKPNQIDPASHVPGYGYGNGYFGLSNFAA